MGLSRAEAVTGARPNIAGDLMRLALASMATGLAAAVAAGAVVMLLA
jgi:hypothetical protein